MEAALVSVGTGAMKPLLSKLFKLLEEERGKIKGVRLHVEKTRDEMSSMQAALEALADTEQIDPEMIVWRDDVPELSYDMEDCVDDYGARIESKHDEFAGSSKGFFHKLRKPHKHDGLGSTGFFGFLDKMKKLKHRHEIAGKIEELKVRAIEASERHKRYAINRLTPHSVTGGIDPRLEAFFVEVNELVGVDDPKAQIIEWIKRDDSSMKLQVLSIVGPGGLGKTTLANAVYKAIESEFACTAFVSLSRKPNIINILRDISRRVNMDYNTEDDERRLIEKLREHLQHKKYFIVVDDMWSTDEWNVIRCALWNNNHGSRIITTTRNSAVASYCSQSNDIYAMKPLSLNDSRRLFLKRAVCPENLLPPNLEKVCEQILKKCAGLPLAIITVASLLADKTAEEEWKKVLAAIGSSLGKEAGNMTKILSLSYFDLPHPMIACLLYLSSYPEDYTIKKRSLIQKWIAEGFIHEGNGRSAYEVGEVYFNELINRSLIQSARSHVYGEVVACRVHDIILDFITCKAKEENFMTTFGDAEQGSKHKLRRLSIVKPKNEMATVSGDLSHIRSLAIFWYFGQNRLLDFPALRVLDLGGCGVLKNEHLVNIENLVLLKYLRLRSGEIPARIGKLKYLQTLDMLDTKIKKLPSTMEQLQRLAHLHADLEGTCLSDGIIGQLLGLEELEEVEVFNYEQEKFLQELGKLERLRTLNLTVACPKYPSDEEDSARLVETLISSCSIHHLTIGHWGYCPGMILSLERRHPSNPAAFQEIRLKKYFIDKIPTWMISLVNLRVLEFSMYRTGPEDVLILGGIPALATLHLKTKYGRNGKILIRGFRSLKSFSLELELCGTAVQFEEGSMPKLEYLHLKFKAHEMECVNCASDFGIQNLSALTKVYVHIQGKESIKDKIGGLIETALGKLRNRPTFSLDRALKGDNTLCYHFNAFIKCYKGHAGSNNRVHSYLCRIAEETNQDAMSGLRLLENSTTSTSTSPPA